MTNERGEYAWTPIENGWMRLLSRGAVESCERIGQRVVWSAFRPIEAKPGKAVSKPRGGIAKTLAADVWRCGVHGCGEKRKSRGLCHKHHLRWIAQNKPLLREWVSSDAPHQTQRGIKREAA